MVVPIPGRKILRDSRARTGARRRTKLLTWRRQDFRSGDPEGNPGPRVCPRRFVGRAPGKVQKFHCRVAVFSRSRWYEGPNGPIAQLDRVTDFYSVGCRFESCWDRHSLWRPFLFSVRRGFLQTGFPVCQFLFLIRARRPPRRCAFDRRRVPLGFACRLPSEPRLERVVIAQRSARYVAAAIKRHRNAFE